MQNNVPSTWDRVWASSIDGVILFIISIPLWANLVLNVVTDAVVLVPWPRVVILVFLPTIYDFVCVWLWGKTPGKWMVGLRIIPLDLTREKPNWIESLIRALMDRLTLFFGYAPYCISFFRYDRSHILDLVAETRVVSSKARPSPAKIRPLSGLVFLLFFAMSTWSSINRWAGSVQLSAAGMSFPGLHISLSEMGAGSDFEWNPKDFESGSDKDANEDKDAAPSGEPAESPDDSNEQGGDGK